MTSPVHVRRPIRAARQLAGRRNRHCWITDPSWTDLRAATAVYPATDSYPWHADAGHDAEPELGRPRAADASRVSTGEACGRGVTDGPGERVVPGQRHSATRNGIRRTREREPHDLRRHLRDPAAGHRPGDIRPAYRVIRRTKSRNALTAAGSGEIRVFTASGAHGRPVGCSATCVLDVRRRHQEPARSCGWSVEE